MSRIQIVEKEDFQPDSLTIIEGLPDVGLVGTIAVSHLVQELGFREIAHIESTLFPPIMVLHKGALTEPIRILGDHNSVIIMSEIAIPPAAVYELGKELTEWFDKKKTAKVISLSGFPVQDRMNIKIPKVYGVGNSEEALKFLKDNGVEVMEEGFIAGMYALLMKECLKKKIPAVTLLAQSFLNYPDPGAAAATLESLNGLLKLKVNIEPLREKADEIRLKARDLMKQAQGSMEGMKKMSEQEIPLMYR